VACKQSLFFNRERNLFIGPVDTRQSRLPVILYASGPSAPLPGWQRVVRRAAGQAGAKKREKGRSGRAGRQEGRQAGREAESRVRGRRTEADATQQRANERFGERTSKSRLQKRINGASLSTLSHADKVIAW
jgi:hypothetical protein